MREILPPREPSARRSSSSATSLIACRWRWCSCCLPGRRDVRVPALGHAPARELHVAHVERRLQLQERHRLLEIEDVRHELIKLSDALLVATGCVLGRHPRMESRALFGQRRLWLERRTVAAGWRWRRRGTRRVRDARERPHLERVDEPAAS